jgi:hypothetical protein
MIEEQPKKHQDNQQWQLEEEYHSNITALN